jgi:FkbM family methyltransferase
MGFWSEQLGVRPKRLFGLNELDIRLANWLRFRRGFFVEVGANDGITQSNTAYLERYLGWRGILIEPIPELAERCRQNRPRAIVEQCALVPFGFPRPQIEMTYCNLMSVVTGARGEKAADADHVKSGRRFLRHGETPYRLKVAARTITAVLNDHDVSRIDLLSLDVEGYEAQVLAGLDFDQYQPRYILVETNDEDAIQSILSLRYDHIATLSHHDRLYALRLN